MGWACGMYGGKEICILASEGNKSLGKCRCSQEDNIKVDLEVGWRHGLDSSASG